MANLYHISNDLIDLFADIENADGEVTDEQYDKLQILESELHSKLKDYSNALAEWAMSEELCKNEKKRINNVQNIYKNRIERLKRAMCNAVINFGEKSPSGSSFIELDTLKFSTRNNSSLEVNEERVNLLKYEFERYVNELVSNGVLYTGEDVDLEGILDSINANVLAEHPEQEPFTYDDLITCKFNINITSSIADFFYDKRDALMLLGNHSTKVNIDHVTEKKEFSDNIKLRVGSGIPCNTVSRLVNNISLIIK